MLAKLDFAHKTFAGSLGAGSPLRQEKGGEKHKGESWPGLGA